MQIKTLDGNLQNWPLTGHFAHAKLTSKSSLHMLGRELITKIYPTLQILEEVPVPIKRSETYYFDFYIPIIKKVIEIHGEQHYKFVTFYHTTQLSFIKSQKRDREKIEWCEINNIKYVELPYNENEEQWIGRITNA
jgi:hypothetical protein